MFLGERGQEGVARKGSENCNIIITGEGGQEGVARKGSENNGTGGRGKWRWLNERMFKYHEDS